ncbi:MAG TPA: NADH-quinone oxidoreductase subunit J, partial [Polyangiaceae bacterium]
LGAVATIAARSPIRSAVGLLTTIVGIAGLFLKLNAQFLAAIQLIVYAGAVVVLFVFVIMLLGPDAEDSPVAPARARASRWIAAALLALLAAAGAVLLFGNEVTPTEFAVVSPEHGSVEAVGRLIFTKGLVPFELATALLIVAVVGAIAVARSRHVVKAPKTGENPTRRLFHGPLHPRDAGRPLPKEGLL